MRSGSNTPARPPPGNVALEWHYKGKPWEAAENYRRGSPLEFVKGATLHSSYTIPSGTCPRIYGRNSRVTLMTKARVDSSDQRSPSAPVFRSSVYTTNSSLPGAHSHRSRKFPLTV